MTDFINAATNTVTGSIYMRDHALHHSPACTFNGWIEQLSVQATDFSILAISVATLLVILQKGHLVQVSLLKKLLICASTWVVPFITSTTVTAMGEMEPVSGNWCWISKDRTDLRYGMTHGWRIAIIFITIGIYTYVWWYVTRHFRTMGGIYGSTWSRSSHRSQRIKHEESVIALVTEDLGNHGPISHGILSPMPTATHPTSMNQPRPHANSTSKVAHLEFQLVDEQSNAQNAATSYIQSKYRQTERDVKRMLLMNGYPIMYVILWIPGLTNRILEASGSTSSSRVLAVLQCSTQFIGFANAVTYGLSGIWRAGR
jgi:hypothetical protein